MMIHYCTTSGGAVDLRTSYLKLQQEPKLLAISYIHVTERSKPLYYISVHSFELFRFLFSSNLKNYNTTKF